MADDAPPELTAADRAVLVALCRPMFTAQEFSTPAAQPEIAAELAVDEATVHAHLERLYATFGLTDDPGVHRVRLAEEAIARGAVTTADVAGSAHGREA